VSELGFAQTILPFDLAKPRSQDMRKTGMRKTVLAALAAAATLSGGMPVHGACLPSFAAPALAAALAPDFSTPAGPVRLASIMCGTNGCNPVQTKQKARRKFQTLGHG
jgi:hypothetical protein